MFRIRLLLVAIALSSVAGCCSPCGGHPWFNWFSSRNCCATPCCDPCNGNGIYGSSGYGTTVIGSPIFAAPAVNGNVPPTVVPGPGAVPVVPPAGAQPNLAKPIPYVPNGK